MANNMQLINTRETEIVLTTRQISLLINAVMRAEPRSDLLRDEYQEILSTLVHADAN